MVKRTCAIEARSEVGEECAPTDTPSYVRTVFCETCRTDGCNANIATDYVALEDEFPLDELRKVQANNPTQTEDNVMSEEDNEDEDEDGADDDLMNDIGRRSGMRESLVTQQDHRTEAVHHAVDPELSQDKPSSAESLRLLSIVSISASLLAIYFLH